MLELGMIWICETGKCVTVGFFSPCVTSSQNNKNKMNCAVEFIVLI